MRPSTTKRSLASLTPGVIICDSAVICLITFMRTYGVHVVWPEPRCVLPLSTMISLVSSSGGSLSLGSERSAVWFAAVDVLTALVTAMTGPSSFAVPPGVFSWWGNNIIMFLSNITRGNVIALNIKAAVVRWYHHITAFYNSCTNIIHLFMVIKNCQSF